MARLCRVPLRHSRLLICAAIFWNIGILLGIFGILSGDGRSIEWLEFPNYASFMLFVAFGLIAVWAVIMFRFRQPGHVYVSQWYLLAAFLWFPWLYSTANILLNFEPIQGGAQGAVNWWYGHNALGLWFTPIGLAAAYYAAGNPHVNLPENPAAMVIDWVSGILSEHGNERVADIRGELQQSMDNNAAVFRTEETLKQALSDIQLLKERYGRISVHDKGKRFNSDLLEAIELGFLLELAEVTVASALNRKETRGGHAREDYPNRDDTNYMRHTMAYKEGRDLLSDVRLDYKPVVQTRYEPMERKY
jgi:hypothetical protein